MRWMIVILLIAGSTSVQLAQQAYSRIAWMPSGWVDADGDGEDARHEVLARSSRRPVVTSASGRIIEGEWIDPYSGITMRFSSLIDIDHLVPLAEAHASGGADWTFQEKSDYANDLRGNHLLAVSASLNRQKGDRDPAGWLPPLASMHCEYVLSWIAIKGRYALSMDGEEVAAIATELERHRC